MPDAPSIEMLLQRAGNTTVFPKTPQLRGRVLRVIAAPARQPVERPRTPRRLPALAAVAVTVIAIVAIVFGEPSSREAVADFFGIEGSEVEVLPTSSAGPTSLPSPLAIDANAVRSSLTDAHIATGFEPALANDREPSSVYLVDYGRSTGVILRYDAFDLWQVEGGSFEGTFGKGVPSPATITDLTISGVPARWISGGGHYVEYVDDTGTTLDGGFRYVERSTLIWRTQFALYRLETDLSLEESMAIAETLP